MSTAFERPYRPFVESQHRGDHLPLAVDVFFFRSEPRHAMSEPKPKSLMAGSMVIRELPVNAPNFVSVHCRHLTFRSR
jgi:hypothetical protein